MKRTLALVLAALLVCLCTACGKEPLGLKPDSGKKTVVLLTLLTDRQPLRIVTQEKGVKVTLQMIEHEPTLGFFRPIADEWEETLTPGREYTIDKEIVTGVPEYRLFVQQGENTAIHNLTSMGFEGREVFELEGGPWAPSPIHKESPMIHLARTAAIVPQDDCGGDLYGYWYATANAISTLRAVDLELEPDDLVPREFDPDDPKGFYRIPEWLFEAYALALYPGMDVPPLGDYDLWVEYHPETYERYWVGQEAYSDSARAEYKSAKQNKDGSWEVTFTVNYTYDIEPEEKVVRLAPNEAYNPNSPFEYHIVGWPEFTYYGEDGPEFDGPPLPENFLGAWTGPVKYGHVAWLEIFADGTAGLYLGDDGSGQLYEIYSGWMTEAPAEGGDSQDITAELHVRLEWYIYESGDGSPVDIPDSYSGLYILRQEGEALYISAGLDAGSLFGKDELELFWTPKVLDGSHMVDIAQ